MFTEVVERERVTQEEKLVITFEASNGFVTFSKDCMIEAAKIVCPDEVKDFQNLNHVKHSS
jgi:hypothetical protein